MNIMAGTNANISTWRSLFSKLLNKAEAVIVPSESAGSIVERYFPQLPYDVLPHPLAISAVPKKEKPSSPSLLRVAVIGDIFFHKGLEPLRDLAWKIEQTHLPVQLYMFGKQHLILDQMKASSIRYRHGRFKREQLPQLLVWKEIDLVLIPSICPETFSYTTNEALQLGYPVLCFALGAQQEAVERLKGGWAIEPCNAEGLYRQLAQLVQNRALLTAAANRLKPEN